MRFVFALAWSQIYKIVLRLGTHLPQAPVVKFDLARVCSDALFAKILAQNKKRNLRRKFDFARFWFYSQTRNN